MSESPWQDRITAVSAPLERAAVADSPKNVSSNIVMLDRGAVIDVLNLLKDAWFLGLTAEGR